MPNWMQKFNTTKVYSRKQGHVHNFSQKGQKGGKKSLKGHKWAKYLKIWVKMYSILKKGK